MSLQCSLMIEVILVLQRLQVFSCNDRMHHNCSYNTEGLIKNNRKPVLCDNSFNYSVEINSNSRFSFLIGMGTVVENLGREDLPSTRCVMRLLTGSFAQPSCGGINHYNILRIIQPTTYYSIRISIVDFTGAAAKLMMFARVPASPRLMQLYIIAFSLSGMVKSQNISPQTVDLATVSGYLEQRACVQECLQESDSGAKHRYGIGVGIGCPYPVLSACLCREDLLSHKSAFLSTCFRDTFNCGEVLSQDLENAISVVNAYCGTNPRNANPTETGADTIAFVTVYETVTSNGKRSTITSTSTSSEWHIFLAFTCLSVLLIV